jgi:hypothetical protein
MDFDIFNSPYSHITTFVVLDFVNKGHFVALCFVKLSHFFDSFPFWYQEDQKLVSVALYSEVVSILNMSASPDLAELGHFCGSSPFLHPEEQKLASFSASERGLCPLTVPERDTPGETGGRGLPLFCKL